MIMRKTETNGRRMRIDSIIVLIIIITVIKVIMMILS